MNIYHFDPNTKEYIEASVAKLDPLESIVQGKEVPIIPANATDEQPPEYGTNQIPIRNGNVWEIKEDYRGTIYYDKLTGNPIIMGIIGPVPETLTSLQYVPYSNWDGSQWVVDIEKVRDAKIASLAAYRYEQETGGIIINNTTIKTDRESQAMINGAKSYSDLNQTALIDWKGENGWIQIGRDVILTIALAVAAHVQVCFSNEKVHSEAIYTLASTENVTSDDINNYDITTGWPT